jgi:hypothetical protein
MGRTPIARVMDCRHFDIGRRTAKPQVKPRTQSTTIGGLIPSFVSWVHLLPASLEIVAWLDAEAEAQRSEYLVSSRSRELIEHVSHNLMMAGLDVSPKRPVHGSAHLSTFADTVESLLAMMGVDP